MSTCSGSSSASVVTVIRSPAPPTSRPIDDRGVRGAVLQQHVAGRPHLPRPRFRTRVVDRDHQVGARGGDQPGHDHVPRLEPVRQRDHRVVVAQRGADRGGHRARRRHPGQHAHGDVDVLRLRRHLQHRGGHREHARVARGHHRDPAARGGEVERVRGPFRLHPVVARVPALAGVGRHAVEVGAVADEVVGRRQHRRDLRGQPVPARPGRCRRRPPRPRSARPRPPSAAAAADRAGQQRDREVGHRRRVDVGELGRALPVGRRPLDVERPSRPASATASRTVVNVRPSFSTAAESVSARRRASSSRGSVPGSTVSTSSRSTSGRPQRRRRRAHRRDTGHDLGAVARCASRLCMCM